MKFHTKFRPGDLVRDKKTGDEGVIIAAEALWRDRHGSLTYRYSEELKRRGETYLSGTYGIQTKKRGGSLNGWWFDDDQLELVAKGFLH